MTEYFEDISYFKDTLVIPYTVGVMCKVAFDLCMHVLFIYLMIYFYQYKKREQKREARR